MIIEKEKEKHANEEGCLLFSLLFFSSPTHERCAPPSKPIKKKKKQAMFCHIKC